jgi:N-terminal domain of anti-restriction factor ArdC
MGMATTTRTRRSSARQQQTEARKAEIELAAKAVDGDEPNFREFLRRWGTRYNENNLARLWVQAPTATVLHKYGTWQAMGRQVRKGEHAILLMHPRTGVDPDKVTEFNPEGKVFFGASWMALFDYAQTDPVSEFAEDDADVQRLRQIAIDCHPDKGGSHEAFVAAWKAYETAKDRLSS